LLRTRNPEKIQDKRLRFFWREIDRDSSGNVNFEHFCTWYLKYFDPANELIEQSKTAGRKPIGHGDAMSEKDSPEKTARSRPKPGVNRPGTKERARIAAVAILEQHNSRTKEMGSASASPNGESKSGDALNDLILGQVVRLVSTTQPRNRDMRRRDTK
jgi:hypothetical protein